MQRQRVLFAVAIHRYTNTRTFGLNKYDFINIFKKCEKIFVKDLHKKVN